MLDRRKLAVIHIVKKELGLTDEAYRHALEQITGAHSARELDETGFRKLMRAFARSRYYRQHSNGITFRQKHYIQHLIEALDWNENHFRNFLKKYYKTSDLESLTKRDASKVINSLKQIDKHHQVS
jgi:hypothetical protein